MPFVPAVYEHKARLVGRSPSEVCRSLDLLLEALERELEVYGPDALTVGPRRLQRRGGGGRLRRPLLRRLARRPGRDGARGLDGPGDLGRLGRPDPGRDGRMPLMIEAAARLNRAAGADVAVRGALSGPFSLGLRPGRDRGGPGGHGRGPAVRPGPSRVRRPGRGRLRRGLPRTRRRARPLRLQGFAGRGLAPRLPRVRPARLPGPPRARRCARRGRGPCRSSSAATRRPILEDLHRRPGPDSSSATPASDLGLVPERCREEKRALRASVDARLVHTGRAGRDPDEVAGRHPRGDGGRGPGFSSAAASWPTIAIRGTSSPCARPGTASPGPDRLYGRRAGPRRRVCWCPGRLGRHIFPGQRVRKCPGRRRRRAGPRRRVC
ncbi:MAG: uroporphyrinogen decarboxylase family protein [Candidatus Moduliflexus flocculans]|nr:uroporphyrinogen decarboxylase family protein [Candidatus Moduliflexus flocculans]